jgi:hypothetical protein
MPQDSFFMKPLTTAMEAGASQAMKGRGDEMMK